MEKKVYPLSNRGMLRDKSISKQDGGDGTQYAYENMNIRITAVDNETLLTITNERNHKVISTDKIKGQTLGHCSVADCEIIFTKYEGKGYIYKVWYDTTQWSIKDERERGLKGDKGFTVDELYSSSNLNFNEVEEIDCIGISETTDLHKVYWVDGVNPNRMLIVEKDYSKDEESIQSPFDFIKNFSFDVLDEFATVKHTYEGTGLMPAGTIQYFLTYYNKMGSETGVVWNSDLLYSDFENRGASPEETTNSSFTITVYKPDVSFDYARIYAYVRTSENAEGIAYIVSDVSLSDVRKKKEEVINSEDDWRITITDNGSGGETIDPSQLLYLGGQEFVSKTLCQKNGKLFLGNISYSEADLSEEITNRIKQELENNQSIVEFEQTNTPSYDNNKRTFKRGETYRVGVQFIKENGVTSRTFFLKDIENNLKPDVNFPTAIKFDGFSTEFQSFLKRNGYTKYRLMYVEPTYADRKIVAQGLVSPTVFNAYDRYANQNSWVMPSWFMLEGDTTNYKVIDAEIQNRDGNVESLSEDSTVVTNSQKIRDEYFHDTSIVTLNSPEFDYEKVTKLNGNYKLRIVGIAEITDKVSSLLLDIDKERDGGGIVQYDSVVPLLLQGQPLYYIESKHDLGYPNWAPQDITPSSVSKAVYYIYPFHGPRIESPWKGKEDYRHFDISKKLFANKRICSTVFTDDLKSYNIPMDNIGLYSNIDKQPLTVNYGKERILYSGDINILSVRPRIGDEYAPYILYYNPYHGSYGYKAKHRITRTDARDHDIDVDVTTEITSIKPLEIGKRYIYSNGGYELTEELENSYLILEELSNKLVGGYAQDPISITYQASTHAVMTLGADETLGAYGYQTLPILTDDRGNTIRTTKYVDFTSTDSITFKTSVIHTEELKDFIQNEYYYIAELYRNLTPYGGDSQTAIEKNVFSPISEITSVDKKVYSNDGDTYLAEYQCLKTMPRNDTDVNQILDITSCTVETHVNLNGRYDTKRYTKDLLTINWNNFAPINNAYNSSNSLITSTTLDERFSNGNYSNMIVHSLTKQQNSKIDTWTNVTMAAYVETDSNNGEVTALRSSNGKVFAFQDKAINLIPYNEQAVVNTQDGVPLEIANNNSVGQPQIVTDKYGCKQMKSIVEAKSGLYFYDDYNQIIASIGEGITPLSTQKGFDIFLREKKRKYQSFYDNRRGDIYFVYDDAIKPTLCYSEYLGEFTSFYSYKQDLMFGIDGHWLSVNNEELFENNIGLYDLQSTIEYKITPEAYGDKLFTNLNYRTDFFDDAEYKSDVTFSTIQVTNEYQNTGEVKIGQGYGFKDGTKAYKKFRIWNLDIPRSINSRDRIRNPWIHLKLTYKPNNEDLRFEFHNATVIYYE